MSPFAVTLVLASTFMHAGWNLLARRGKSETVFFGRMLLLVAVAGLIPASASEMLSRSLTPTAWRCVVLSGLCCAVYYFGLARAYASADFTVVYPVARAIPVVLVALGDVLRSRAPAPLGWAGIALVAGGCLLVPLHSFHDFAPRRYLQRAGAWIALTAVGTVGYTLLDKLAAETVQQGPATAARYGYAFFLVSFVGYRLLVRLFKRPGPPTRSIGWSVPALGAVFNFGAYWLVLWAYQSAGRASYVVAFRQFSIVIGVVLAFAIYKERGRAVRLTGTFLILAGLILIGVWGA